MHFGAESESVGVRIEIVISEIAPGAQSLLNELALLSFPPAI